MSKEDSKQEVQHVEDTGSLNKGSVGPLEDVDPAFERRTMRKVDWRLLPPLGGMYAISLIDRSNISLARVAGMQVDLQLGIGERYSIVALMFFVPYIIFELPSNLVLRRFGIANWLSFIVVAWGAVTIGMAFCKTWIDLLVCRVLLGTLEAGFFPGTVLLISTWFTRFETAKRMSAFYLLANVVAGFSAILAYGLSQLKGRLGLNGWRWIFLVEGILTVGVGIIGWFLLVDFPDKAKFLTEEERFLVLDRIQRDRGDAEYEEVTRKSLFTALADPLLWCFALLFMASTMATYVVAYFAPPIMLTLGFSTKESQILVTPLYVVGAAVAFGGAWLSDKYRCRSAFVATLASIAMTGIIIVGYAKSPKPRYLGLYMVQCGGMGEVPAVLAWMTNNIIGTSKKSVGSALVIGFGGIGGIAASTVFRQKDAPKYIPGILTLASLQAGVMLLSGILALFFHRQNKRAREGKIVIEKRPGFFYTL